MLYVSVTKSLRKRLTWIFINSTVAKCYVLLNENTCTLISSYCVKISLVQWHYFWQRIIVIWEYVWPKCADTCTSISIFDSNMKTSSIIHSVYFKRDCFKLIGNTQLTYLQKQDCWLSISKYVVVCLNYVHCILTFDISPKHAILC